MAGQKRIAFKRTLPGTAEWAYFDEKGCLVVELYDHSAEAENWFGGDIATLVKIHPRDLDRLLRHLRNPNVTPLDDFLGFFRKDSPALSESDRQDEILRRLEEKFEFSGYFKIQKWLEEKKIRFEKIFEH